MSIVVPRPAMRSKERIIKTRLDWYAAREIELRGLLVIHASDIAFKEAYNLRFNRDGYLAEGSAWVNRPAPQIILPPAIIYVGGEEFIRCLPGDDFRALFEKTVEQVGGEVVLMVWKPHHNSYLRERLSMTAEVYHGA